MQPYFFPYLGYYALIQSADKWIVFDEVQFIRHGWIERNRILKPNSGWQYISAPLEKHSRSTLIKDIKIKNTEDWKARIFNQLEHYKKKAPYYRQVLDFLNQAFLFHTEYISLLNAHLLNESCNYLSIPFHYEIYSGMNTRIDPINEPGDWALNISKAIGASCYINPIGGIALFNKKKFDKKGIDLKFLKFNLIEYNQHRSVFEPGLSIIDVMMFNSPGVIREILNQCELI
jgi:hypothetical protein